MDQERGSIIDADAERAEPKSEGEQDVRCKQALQLERAVASPCDATVADEADDQQQPHGNSPKEVMDDSLYLLGQRGQATGLAEIPPRRVPTVWLFAFQRFLNAGIEVKGVIFNAVEKKASSDHSYYNYQYTFYLF